MMFDCLACEHAFFWRDHCRPCLNVKMLNAQHFAIFSINAQHLAIFSINAQHLAIFSINAQHLALDVKMRNGCHSAKWMSHCEMDFTMRNECQNAKCSVSRALARP